MRKVVGRFAAAGSDGRAYSVEVVRTVPARVEAGQSGELGETALFTTNGVPVTRVRQGKYRVDGTDVTLTSSVPTAP
jgi:hypothetical protein